MNDDTQPETRYGLPDDVHHLPTPWSGFTIRDLRESRETDALMVKRWSNALRQREFQLRGPKPDDRPCTCHPEDSPPQPCAKRYALAECKAHVLLQGGTL